MRRTVTYLLLLLQLPLLLAGCGGRRAVEAQFAPAAAVVPSEPDSALRLLRAIDTARLRTRRQRMEWRMLTARAQLLADEQQLDKAFTAPLYAYYEKHGPRSEQAIAAYLHAHACQNEGDIDQAVKAYTRAAICAEGASDDRETLLLLGAVYHTLGALHLEQGYNVEAEEAFRKAVAIGQRCGNEETEGYARFMLSAALCAQRRFDEAIEELAPLVAARDTLRFRYFAQQITLQNLLYHAYAGDWDAQRLLAERARIDLGAIDSAPLSYGRKLRQRDERIGEYLALIDSYRESQDSLTSRLDASDSREAALKELLEGRFAHIRDIAATCYTYGEGARLSEKMRQLALSPATLADVVRMADLYNRGAVSRLREAFPGWTERNHDFAALVIAGFSPQEICVMLGMTPNGVYTLKSKLKRRIAESDIAAREELLRFFA